jgi:hypothetical protein
MSNGYPRQRKHIWYELGKNEVGRKTYLGALMFSNVKTTSGACAFGVAGLPSKIRVSPLKTLFTRATPLDGRMIGRGLTAVMVFSEELLLWMIKGYYSRCLCKRVTTLLETTGSGSFILIDLRLSSIIG